MYAGDGNSSFSKVMKFLAVVVIPVALILCIALTGCTALRKVAKVVWLFVEDNPNPERDAWDDLETETP